jgi:predicted kinase
MPVQPFILQMAGLPGSGKSSLARLVGHRTSAVVLDKDVLKTAALDMGLEDQRAGALAYESLFALGDHLIGQGASVIFDSPSFYESIPLRGQAIAEARCAPYYFIECTCPDREELAKRLQQRRRLASHSGREALDIDVDTCTPSGGHLRLDTTLPIARSLASALDYLGFEQ